MCNADFTNSITLCPGGLYVQAGGQLTEKKIGHLSN